jgi:hypothetical protein
MAVFSFAFKEVRNQRFLDCLTPSASAHIWPSILVLDVTLWSQYVCEIEKHTNCKKKNEKKPQREFSCKFKCFKPLVLRQGHTIPGQIVWDCQCLWSQVSLLFSIVEIAYVQHVTVKESNRGEIRPKSQKSESSKNASKCFKSEIRTKQQHTQMLIFLCLDSNACVWLVRGATPLIGSCLQQWK